MASTAFEVLRKCRETFQTQVEDLTISLGNIYSDTAQIEATLSKYVNDEIVSKKLYGHNVAKEIESMKSADALTRVHHVMARYQEVSVFIQVEILARVNTLSSDATALYNMNKVELINSEIILRNISTSAQREAEVAFQLSKATLSFSKINTAVKNIKATISMIDEQISYLNKLDAMLRLKYNMKVNSNYIDQHGSGEVESPIHQDGEVTYNVEYSEL